MTDRSRIEKIRKWGAGETFWRTVRRGLQISYRRLRFFRPAYRRYLRLRKRDGFVVETVNGYRMRLDLKNDLGISQELCVHKKREIGVTDYLLKSDLAGQGDVVLDIGANIGYYALIWSGLIGESGRVYALEPVTNNFKLLKTNIELNRAGNIEAYNLAAGSENKRDYINVASRGNISSFIAHDRFSFQGRQEVEIVRIDDFLKSRRPPSIVRMDVEGYAGEILKGMEETLVSSVKYLLIETHPWLKTGRQKEEIVSILARNDFQVKKIFFEDIADIPPRGFYHSAIGFVHSRIFPPERVRAKIEEINREGNLMKLFEEGGYNVLFEKRGSRKTGALETTGSRR